MAKFVYRMQNILKIKEKMESQEKIAFSIANGKLLEEEEKLKCLLTRKADYERQLKELGLGVLNIKEIQTCKRSIEAMKALIREQMLAVHTAQRNVELARKRLDEVMKERKTHENLKEKAFEAFKEEVAAEENKAIDGLVSFTYQNREQDLE